MSLSLTHSAITPASINLNYAMRRSASAALDRRGWVKRQNARRRRRRPQYEGNSGTTQQWHIVRHWRRVIPRKTSSLCGEVAATGLPLRSMEVACRTCIRAVRFVRAYMAGVLPFCVGLKAFRLNRFNVNKTSWFGLFMICISWCILKRSDKCVICLMCSQSPSELIRTLPIYVHGDKWMAVLI